MLHAKNCTIFYKRKLYLSSTVNCQIKEFEPLQQFQFILTKYYRFYTIFFMFRDCIINIYDEYEQTLVEYD